jgi:hypothetical protein
MKYTNDWGNIQIQNVERLALLSEFFQCSNVIDKHNQADQAESALGKCWLVQNPFFRLFSSIFKSQIKNKG